LVHAEENNRLLALAFTLSFSGKGEKVRQELTRRVVTRVLCIPEAESSCIPANKREGDPPEPEGRTMETYGDIRSG